jgi:mannose-6-phosphate isomerase-like protein (cupin superfamily)
MIERIEHNGQLIAILIRSNYQAKGIQFFTPDEFSQQLAYMNRPKGHAIDPHVHNPISREIVLTQEVLLIRSGKVRVDFYNDARHYLESRILQTGDVILLAGGGHGFEMLERTEMIEVKQGPYCGEGEKTRFAPVDKEKTELRITASAEQRQQ